MLERIFQLINITSSLCCKYRPYQKYSDPISSSRPEKLGAVLICPIETLIAFLIKDLIQET